VRERHPSGVSAQTTGTRTSMTSWRR
jgi:hypothetical protein